MKQVNVRQHTAQHTRWWQQTSS